MPQSGVGGPWRIDVAVGDRESAFALKAERFGPEEQRRFATAAAALEFAALWGVPAPRPVAHDLNAQCGWLASLSTLLPGSSGVATKTTSTRLQALGAEAARIHLASGPLTANLPLRSRSLEGYDLEAAGSSTASTPLLARAREVVANSRPSQHEPIGFVHGDFWQGNTLWDGEQYAGAVDWDFAGFGPAGIDLGSLRADVTVLHGPEAADEVLAGWEQMADKPAPNLAWWDLIAGTCTPADMRGWLPNFHAQGRTDLDLETITRRRDDYLDQALRALD